MATQQTTASSTPRIVLLALLASVCLGNVVGCDADTGDDDDRASADAGRARSDAGAESSRMDGGTWSRPWTRMDLSAAPQRDAQASANSCDSDSGVYQAGDTFRVGCASCSCDADGTITCNSNACPTNGRCKMGDRDFAKGTTVPCRDGCNLCGCDPNAGGWSRTLALCGPLPQVVACSELLQADAPVVSVIYLAGPDPERPGAPDVLAVKGDFAGGCAVHDFKLCYGAFRENEAIQLPVWLEIDHAPDPCAGSKRRTLDFVYDLTPIRAAYRDQYQAQSGTIDLAVGGTSLSYAF